MTELRDVVKQCVERLERYRRTAQQVGEQYTKAGLIEPVIAALGWDVLDPDEVQRGYLPGNGDSSVDYALLLLRTPRLFIKARGLGDDLDDPRSAAHLMTDAAEAGVEWVALTDGAEWRVYNARVAGPVEQKLFRSVRLEDDSDGTLELLSLLSKANMRDNRISELWPGFFVDRQVHAALVDLFREEQLPQLVALLYRRLPRLSREEIRLSLLRARATFDFPAATVPFTAGPARAPAAHSAAPTHRADVGAAEAQRPPFRTTATARPGKPRVSPEERKLHLTDMIAVGRLRPGSILVAKYFGQHYQAELLADGNIRYGRRPFTSPSGAGEAVKIDVHGPDVPPTTKATDGLDFWHTEDARTGDFVSLKEIRRRTAADLSRPRKWRPGPSGALEIPEPTTALESDGVRHTGMRSRPTD
ncbi:hypothetical protein ACN26Y_21470 [Micromonospora sp. WMMD558]|uniref:restriction system modified-DNA reader domain-containing protein n=1 Tax=Micromonospora sp. WMMD558 TaxID=3403462 RepID=UPI003BF47DDC